MNIITRYECNICKHWYDTQKYAEYCEENIIPNPNFKIGDSILVDNGCDYTIRNIKNIIIRFKGIPNTSIYDLKQQNYQTHYISIILDKPFEQYYDELLCEIDMRYVIPAPIWEDIECLSMVKNTDCYIALRTSKNDDEVFIKKIGDIDFENDMDFYEQFGILNKIN